MDTETGRAFRIWSARHIETRRRWRGSGRRQRGDGGCPALDSVLARDQARGGGATEVAPAGSGDNSPDARAVSQMAMGQLGGAEILQLPSSRLRDGRSVKRVNASMNAAMPRHDLQRETRTRWEAGWTLCRPEICERMGSEALPLHVKAAGDPWMKEQGPGGFVDVGD